MALANDYYEVDVAIVGGGPAGLALAHSCYYHKLSFVVLEKSLNATQLSKATGIHPHSMEYLHKFDLLNDVLRHAVKLDKCIVFVDGEIKKTIAFSHGLKSCAQNVSLSQEVLEKIMASKLPHESVLYGYEALCFEDSNDTVTLQAKTIQTGELKTFKSRFLAAADGGKSFIRKALNIDFPGETNPELGLSFDAKIDTVPEPNTMLIYSGQAGRAVCVPITNNGEYKVSGGIGDFSEKFTTKDMMQIVEARCGLCIVEDTILNCTYYHTHSQIADRFRRGNTCLLGDAAHVFYPAGGYGLNLAIEDAVYLGEALSVFFQYGYKEVLDDYAHYRREVSLLAQADSKKKKSQSMDAKAEKSNEKQVYELEEYQAVNYDSFLRAISKYKAIPK